MSKMAPACTRCCHKASEHHKQMRMRTYCTRQDQRQLPAGVAIDGGDTVLEQETTAYQQCLCLMYKGK